MSDKVDISVLELLASKICHDLISPIGAINNGLEFMQDMGDDAGPEAAELVAFSAQQASAKLQAYRMAYGEGGADSNIKPEDAHKAIESIVSAENKIRQDWDPHGDIGHEERPTGFCKVLVCGLLLGMEGLPRGGILAVSKSDSAQTVITASGEGAGFRGNVKDALTLGIPPSALEPKDAHAYMTGLMARKYGFHVQFDNGDDEKVVLTISAT